MPVEVGSHSERAPGLTVTFGQMKLTVEHFLTRYLALNPTCDKVLVAVSGGLDSMVLAHLMHTAKVPFAIAHINYRLRENESEEDAAFVSEYALRYHVDYFPYTVTDQEQHALKTSSTQEQARAIRYHWFRETMATNPLNAIVTAHHADDQTETMLFHFIRGSGPLGLAGMNEQSNDVMRPLLQFTRNEILEYAAHHGVSWREDRSNLDTKYTRNRLRNELIPLIEDIHPSFSQRMSGLSPVYRETAVLIQQSMQAQLNEHVQHMGNAHGISANWLAHFSFPLLFLVEWLTPTGFTFAQCTDALSLLGAETGKHIASDTHELWKDRDMLWMVPAEKASFSQDTLREEDTQCMQLPLQSYVIEADQWQLDPSPNVAQLDDSKLAFPLTIRRWRDGDRIRPIGLEGSQKVSDILVQAKVPLFLKSSVCVAECNNQVIWVVGYRVSDEYKVTADTRRVRILSWGETFEKVRT